MIPYILVGCLAVFTFFIVHLDINIDANKKFILIFYTWKGKRKFYQYIKELK